MVKRRFLYIAGGAGVIMVVAVILIYNALFSMSIIPEKGRVSIYIPTGSSYSQVIDSLDEHLDIPSMSILKWVAEKKQYPLYIKPGRYVISEKMSYVAIINLLRSGRQTPVKITFNNIRTLNQIAGKIGSQIEADSTNLMNFFTDDANYISDGFKKETIISLFIPDTYEMYWNTDASSLYKRLLKEYRLFWNKERLVMANAKNLNPIEVSILASIIDDEVVKQDEKPRIAGVYLNRLKRGIPLQACPTIKFALNDFTITRVLYVHLQVDSPYNTYRHNGFPPGPIGCPSKEGIDAVLNAEKHDYLFFAAKPDFSGYHNFSRTLSEHNRYAAQYQKELDKRRIFR
jgi:UPF0755 protein